MSRKRLTGPWPLSLSPWAPTERQQPASTHLSLPVSLAFLGSRQRYRVSREVARSLRKFICWTVCLTILLEMTLQVPKWAPPGPTLSVVLEQPKETSVAVSLVSPKQRISLNR